MYKSHLLLFLYHFFLLINCVHSKNISLNFFLTILSLIILTFLGHYNDYFQIRFDSTFKICLLPLWKFNVAIRMLAYESPVDIVDEYVRETPTIQYKVNRTPYNIGVLSSRWYIS